METTVAVSRTTYCYAFLGWNCCVPWVSMDREKVKAISRVQKAVLTTWVIFWCMDIQRKNTVSTSRKCSKQQGPWLQVLQNKVQILPASCVWCGILYQDQQKTAMAEILLPIFTQEQNVALWEKLACGRGLFSILPPESLNYCWAIEEFLILKRELVWGFWIRKQL